jgi:CDP-glycerol glycerophosphotransferase (TagB/SpsB family)
VPGFIAGLKVQVFHGLNEDKRGSRYPERGLFDLYCTEGPQRSAMLQSLQQQKKYFRVAETGWLKLDTLLNYDAPRSASERPQILFTSTFTPNLSGAEALYPVIKQLSTRSNWQWLITLHPKMNQETVARYRALQNDNLSFFETSQLIELLHTADLMVSDNSSVLQEFLLLKKPVVTYRSREPQPWLINITEPEQLASAITEALNPAPKLLTAISTYGASVTPWLDGASAPRIMDEAEQMLAEGWQNRKPLNIWRNLKMRRQLNYYGF